MPRWNCPARLVLAVAVVLGARVDSVRGQLAVFVANGTATAATEKPPAAFTLQAQTNDVKDALADFQRVVQHEAWDKAFKSLETIANKTTTGFVERPDGVLVPSRQLMQSLLASLPPAGKSAYRVFYDAQANTLWEGATGKAELENLAKIVNSHLVSSVGDSAADRLGDLYYERGEVPQAIAAWRSVLDVCQDTKLSKPLLLAKMATALSHEGRVGELREVAQTIAERYADEKVEIAGRQQPVGQYVAHLVERTNNGESRPTLAGIPADIELPSVVEPLWQFRFQSKDDPATADRPFQIMDMYGRQRANDFPIPSAVDASRLYLNAFGVEMAFDLATGKMLWRTGRLHQLNFQQNRQGVLPERYSISAAGDRTWSVTREPQQINNSPPAFALVARDAATGKELFSSRRTMSSWHFTGVPLITDKVIYICATKSNQNRELSLLLLDAKDGKLQKAVPIGTHVIDPNQSNGERSTVPSMCLVGDRLYLDTHAGALVSLQAGTGVIDWGVLYESPAQQQNYYYYEYVPPQYGLSGPLFAGGLVFAKGMRSPRLMGLRADGPTVAWNRPVADRDVLVGADDDCVYLGGDDLAAYSLQTQELVWATRLPRSAAWSVPRLTKTKIYQFSARGVYEVDKRTGRVLRLFRGVDLDAFGGTLHVTDSALVTVSNLAVTAYPLPPSVADKGTN